MVGTVRAPLRAMGAVLVAASLLAAFPHAARADDTTSPLPAHADLGPMRLARRVPLLALQIQDRRSGYPLETVVRGVEAGWHIASVEVDYHPRTGRSKVTGTPLGALRAVTDMARVLGS